ncbi:MAG: hypothetical protein ACREEM_30850, partial [Blastocatellia bacterium]
MSILNRFWNWLQPPPSGLPRYGLLYFDHLLGLYDTLDPTKLEPGDRQRLEAAREQRADGSLTWKDVYSFELTLLKYLDLESLRARVISVRSHYRNVAGQKEYESYLALKPPDPVATDDKNVLRRDLEYLCNEFYLRYSLMSSREHLRSNLLKLAALFTAIFSIGGAALLWVNSQEWVFNRLPLIHRGITTISVVVFAGIIGAFISVQQRIQSAPSEGDPIYNFSVLTHGVFGIFLSPISGAIFAVILYLMFAGGVLQGKAFPRFNTSTNGGSQVGGNTAPTPTPEASPSPAPSPTAEPSPKPTTESRTASTPIPQATTSAGMSLKPVGAGTPRTSTSPINPPKPESKPPDEPQTSVKPSTSSPVLFSQFSTETG